MLHDELCNRIEISGTLVLQSGLHVGSASGGGITNAAVMRDGRGRPFIPGASLKGCLRARLEAVAHLLGRDVPVCFLERSDDTLCAGDKRKVAPPLERCLSRFRDGAKYLQLTAQAEAAPASDDPDKKMPTLETCIHHHLCPVCRLLGGASWRGKLAIDDLALLEAIDPPVDIRDGVGIDRDTRTAVGTVKYDLEAVPASTRFRFQCTAENLNDADWRLLATGLEDLAEGNLPLGGKKTRGLGQVQLQDATLTFTDFHEPDQALAFFLQQTPEKQPLAQALKSLAENLPAFERRHHV